jgi:hypothetical protein
MGSESGTMMNFMLVITIVQFWWIAVWGIMYIVIELVAGKSKQKEFWFYIGLMILTLFVIAANPRLIEKL